MGGGKGSQAESRHAPKVIVDLAPPLLSECPTNASRQAKMRPVYRWATAPMESSGRRVHGRFSPLTASRCMLTVRTTGGGYHDRATESHRRVVPRPASSSNPAFSLIDVRCLVGLDSLAKLKSCMAVGYAWVRKGSVKRSYYRSLRVQYCGRFDPSVGSSAASEHERRDAERRLVG